MGLEKGIKHGKEHRTEYRGCKAVDKTCRNHGGCLWCERNRKKKFAVKEMAADGRLKDYKKGV